jgi:tRNA (cmo5U34)-methyltransferase
MSASEAFADGAREYDATRRRLVPPFDAFYGTVVDVLGMLEQPPRRVLDLGAGTGLLAEKIHDAYPKAKLELLDGSPEMLDVARERLPGATFHTQDMRDPLPEGEFDAVVSALAIHHLENEAKRDLFARIRDVLPAHGVFVLADQVSGPRETLTAHYLDVWARQCKALGATEEELAAARERMQHDRCADTGALMEWVLDAGFPECGCVYKSWWWTVIVGFVTIP